MYSNQEHVNTLTALLVSHGVRHAVVCPGSRNAPIVHNLVACPDIDCHSVTDERSAGFYALGMSLAASAPVAVCVTSGTALLNLLPAVAEAYYRHVPLVVISADRPPQWIDQFDGQTLPQGDALGRFVRRAVTLPATQRVDPAEGGLQPDSDEAHWHCNRLVNEALLATRLHGGGPVHINVPLSEPLYAFTVETLPDERAIFMATSRNDKRLLNECAGQFVHAQRPLLVVGQALPDVLQPDDLRAIESCTAVLNESLSLGNGGRRFDAVLQSGHVSARLVPDFVLVMGGILVSKPLKQFLRRLPKEVPVWAVSDDGLVRDTFRNLYGVIEGHPADVLADLIELAGHKQLAVSADYADLWRQQLAAADKAISTFLPGFSAMAAVKMLEETLRDDASAAMHYGNSTAVRLANIYAHHYVYCNRGVSGIEGTLSTAAGFALASEADRVFCVLGDLSFFYDANGLWNQDLRQNLRILLLNNGGGGIFERFEGLKDSPARERFVMGRHATSAQSLCQGFDIAYRAARNMTELTEGIGWLASEDHACRPQLLEVFTDTASDEQAQQALLKHLSAHFPTPPRS